MGLKDRTRIEQLVREKRGVTADTAVRLARVFGASAEFWTNLQATHDLPKAAGDLGAGRGVIKLAQRGLNSKSALFQRLAPRGSNPSEQAYSRYA